MLCEQTTLLLSEFKNCVNTQQKKIAKLILLLVHATKCQNVKYKYLFAGKFMHPREALNKVIEVHKLKAVDIAKASGVNVHEISKFRNGHKDMTTSTFFKIAYSLPNTAKSHLLALCLFKNDEDNKYHNLKVPEKKTSYKV